MYLSFNKKCCENLCIIILKMYIIFNSAWVINDQGGTIAINLFQRTIVYRFICMKYIKTSEKKKKVIGNIYVFQNPAVTHINLWRICSPHTIVIYTIIIVHIYARLVWRHVLCDNNPYRIWLDPRTDKNVRTNVTSSNIKFLIFYD